MRTQFNVRLTSRQPRILIPELFFQEKTLRNFHRFLRSTKELTISDLETKIPTRRFLLDFKEDLAATSLRLGRNFTSREYRTSLLIVFFDSGILDDSNPQSPRSSEDPSNQA